MANQHELTSIHISTHLRKRRQYATDDSRHVLLIERHEETCQVLLRRVEAAATVDLLEQVVGGAERHVLGHARLLTQLDGALGQRARLAAQERAVDGLGDEREAERGRLAGIVAALMVAYDVDVGQQLEQHALGRLDHAIADGRRDAHRVRHAANALDLARVGEIHGHEFHLGRTAEVTLAAAVGLGAAFAQLEFEAVVAAQEALEHRQRRVLEHVDGDVERVVGDARERHVHRLFGERRQARDHLQVVADGALQLTVECELAADEQTGHEVERRARLVDVRARAVGDRVDQLEQIHLEV